MQKTESLQDLQRIAIAKHGEDQAWVIAHRFGNPQHKEPWRKAIAEPSKTAKQVLDHQLWQQSIREQFGI